MGKVDTDQGLGPGSERTRLELLKKDDPPKTAEQKTEQKEEREAVTSPGIGRADRVKEAVAAAGAAAAAGGTSRSPNVDDLLEGFGPSRPDLPRILPQADTTPPPEPVHKELTPTAPGARQRTRNVILATVGTFVLVVGFGVLIVKLSSSTRATTQPTTKGTNAVGPVTGATALSNVGADISTANQQITPTITTMQVDSLPTAKTASTGRPLHTGGTATTATATVATATTATQSTTATAPHPTGSAPPGMNLLPDDPHR